MAKHVYQPDSFAATSFACGALRGVGVAPAAGGADSGTIPWHLLKRPQPPRREAVRRKGEEWQWPAEDITGEGVAEFGPLVAKGRGTVKAPRRPRRPAPKPAPPPAVGGSGLQEAFIEGVGAGTCYDYERIRRDDLELLGMI